MKRDVLAWALAPCVLLAVYWTGLWAWFHHDDFTLLWQAQLPAREFWPHLLEPRAQGTYRPLSERLYFYSFHQWFGFNAFPFRLWVFGTQTINLWLFAAVARRLSGSLAVGVLGACLWAMHHGLAATMSWSSAYNQALCSFFLLVSFWLFLRFAESGRISLYVLQWLTFLAGFGALESIVLYPALLIAWCVLFRRDRLRWAMPILAGSLVLTWIQISGPSGGRADAYALVFAPAALAETLLYYGRTVFSANGPSWLAWAIGLPLGGLALCDAAKGRQCALFGWIWFVLALAPFLPLAHHLSGYYLFFPSAGLALAAATVAVYSWEYNWVARAAAVGSILLWIAVTVPAARKEAASNYAQSVRARDLVSALASARARHPNKTLLLSGIDETFFNASIGQQMLPVAGLFNVYLAPVNFPADGFTLPAEQTRRALLRDSLIVYDASSSPLLDVTLDYRQSLAR